MEANELLSLMGFETPEEGEANIDQVREHFNNTFIPVSEINEKHPAVEKIIGSSFGQKMGSLQTALVSHAKENGLDLKHSDFKDKKIDEVIPEIFGGFKKKLETQKKPDNKLTEELERWKNEANQYQETIEQMSGQIEETKNQFESEKKNWLINHAENEAWNGVNFSKEANDLMKRGFKATVKEKYSFVTDDEGKVWPVHNQGEKKGSRVQNPNDLSKMMGIQDLLKHEAKANGLLAATNEGQPGGKPADRKPSVERDEPNKNVRVHPRFAGQLEK